MVRLYILIHLLEKPKKWAAIESKGMPWGSNQI